ncbi:MAG TPA: VWA domain-containing protein [Candidatus Micrarchaeia archaeon]|nr:VWA domain-containing protein [Candidatus Micrarchaeia archaeon]
MRSPRKAFGYRPQIDKLPVVLLLLSTLAILGQGFTLPSSAAGTATQAKITSTTTLVVLPVNVTDAKGAFVSALKPENFKVFEDGRLQGITLFKEEDTPVTVGLIVDHSRSMGPKLSAVAFAVNAFAHSSNPEDEMFVVDFNENVSVELMRGKPFTHDAAELQQALSAVSAQGQTALYDAVSEGLTHVDLGQWDKKALIIVSDGGDNASHTTFSELLKLARQSHVVIYSIGLVDEAGEEENPKVLTKLSSATGGITFLTKRSDEAARFMKQIARDLREQYTLGYVPPTKNNRNSFRKIVVRVSSPDAGKLRVRTRPGYFPSPSRVQSVGALGDWQ